MRSPVSLLLLLLLWGAACSRDAPRPGEEELNSVAVLPLRNESLDPGESDYLALGITRAVITKLTQAGLRVTPWETARRYVETEEAPEDVARELGVDAVLVGTFELAGDRILTTLSLVDESGLQSWADEFEEPFDDLFGVQRRIAMGAAESLSRELSGEQVEILEAAESVSVDAYDLFLQGAHLTLEGTEEATGVAARYFTQALELDPGLKEARVGLGTVHYNRFYFGWGGLADLREAEASFRKALELDPGFLRAHRGLVHIHFEKGLAEECLRQGQAIARHPSPDAVDMLLARAEAYNFGGLDERAMPLLERVIELDPGNREALGLTVIFGWYPPYQAQAIEAGEAYLERFGEDREIHTWVGAAYYLDGQKDRARQHYDRAVGLSLDGDEASFEGEPDQDGLIFGGLLYDELGEVALAETVWRRGADSLESKLEASPDNYRLRLMLASLYGLLGDRERLWEEERRAFAIADVNPFAVHYVAAVHARIGEPDRAVELYLRALDQGTLPLVWKGFLDFMNAPVPQSEAFQEFLEGIETQHRERSETY